MHQTQFSEKIPYGGFSQIRSHIILFGGDQLTVKRARGTQHVRSNSLRGKDRLERTKASSGRLARECILLV